MPFKHFITAFLLSFGVFYQTVPFEGHLIPVIYDSHIRVKHIHDNADILCGATKDCKVLAEQGYYEARNQSDSGMLAVMKVVLNRVSHHKWPNDIKSVVYHKCQFSYTCDGSLGRRKANNDQWRRSYKLAYLLLTGYKDINLKGSTHYHTTKIMPYWAKEFKKTVVIQDHVFYKCTGYC